MGKSWNKSLCIIIRPKDMCLDQDSEEVRVRPIGTCKSRHIQLERQRLLKEGRSQSSQNAQLLTYSAVKWQIAC